mmetsp:Transcript_6031/g.8433  ORF Transcript_6031/g.8433 Transcript_6031/m.8433 type:complete len:282 (-) Transcript_6031:175-1020(-)
MERISEMLLDFSNETHSRADTFMQIYREFPVLAPFYFQFEKEYAPGPIFKIMTEMNYRVTFIVGIFYLSFCYFGPKFMKDKKPFDLLPLLSAWNLFLSIFSAYGAIRTVPHMLYRIYTLPFEQTVCESIHSAFGTGACGLAVQLFVFSKIPELIDTVFIVLRKKPLVFLHWYHHITVLLYCWNAYVTESAAGLYFVSMNYTVHAVMYFYFYLQAVKLMPKWFPSWIITVMQISQMIVGTFIVGACMYYHFYGGSLYRPGKCHNEVSNLVAGGVSLMSNLLL